MVSLVLNAPQEQVNENNKKSFQSIINSRIGVGYVISKGQYEQLYEGCQVILLCKDRKQRAEGKLRKLIPTEKAGNGIQRYDVYMDDLKLVKYKPELLNRAGVAVI